MEIKKSRFIARAGLITKKETMKSIVHDMTVDYPDARHYCWAYLIGNPARASTAAMHDAGEPSGTAGKPILNVIQHKHIGDVYVVVARYFGGIKLGAGGLVRAYAGAAEQVLSQLKTIEQQPMVVYKLSMPFAKEQYVRHFLETHDGNVSDVNYMAEVLMDVEITEKNSKVFIEFCQANQIDYENPQ